MFAFYGVLVTGYILPLRLFENVVYPWDDGFPVGDVHFACVVVDHDGLRL